MDNKHNIMVIGSGGREHALAWKLSSSPLCGQVYCMPGNGGISAEFTAVDEIPCCEKLTEFIRGKDIGLVFVGPEAPLAAGISDFLTERGVSVIGPVKAAARLESSKIFAKEVMRKAGILTAPHESFSCAEKALEYISSADPERIVIKADGLCAGKGVVLPGSSREAREAVEKIMNKKAFGPAGENIIIEERLEGREASVLLMLNGDKYAFMLPSRDHKSAFEGGRGPNTGGMGALAPAPDVTPEIISKVERSILLPLIDELSRRGVKYTGILYIGLIISENNPFVLEFNVRLGDPETQAVLPLLESDLLAASLELLEGGVPCLSWREGFCVNAVLASGGYPGKYRTGFPLEIDYGSMPPEAVLFHSGTELRNGRYYTSGGRVISVSACGENLQEARDRAYAAAGCIRFEGMRFRSDIGEGGI